MRNASDGSAIATRAGDGSTASRPFLSRCSRARASPSRASRPSRDASPRRSRAPPRPSSRPARESWRRSPSARPTPRTRTRRVARTPPPPTSSSPSPPEDVSSTRARSPPSSPRPTFSHPACVHVHPVPASVHFLNRPGVSRGTPHPPRARLFPKPALLTRQSPTVSQETTLAYEAPTDTNAFSLPFDADARTAAETPPFATVAFAAFRPGAAAVPDVASARSAVVRVHVIADPPTASPAIDAFPTSMTTLEDVAADVFLVGSADPAFVAATGTSSGSGSGSGSGSLDWESREVAARDSTAVFLRVLVNPSHGWVYADGVLLRAGDVVLAAAGDACARGIDGDGIPRFPRNSPSRFPRIAPRRRPRAPHAPTRSTPSSPLRIRRERWCAPR